MEERKLARNKLITYLILVFAFSSFFYYQIAQIGDLDAAGMWVFGLMWMPAAAAVITALIFQRNLRGFGWGPGKIKYLVYGFAIPFVYTSIAYAFIWITGLGRLSSTGGLLDSIINGATLGVLQAIILVLGEEIGWRGMMTPQLAKLTSFNKTALIGGVIWGLWHVPIIMFGGYNNGAPVWYSMLAFFILIISMNFVFTWLRLASGSIWPAVIMHAVHNVFIQSVYEPLTENAGMTQYFSDEFGAVLAVIGIIAAIFISRIAPPTTGDTNQVNGQAPLGQTSKLSS
jgi:membrane protease YdiL (CAAX protease family)